MRSEVEQLDRSCKASALGGSYWRHPTPLTRPKAMDVLAVLVDFLTASFSTCCGNPLVGTSKPCGKKSPRPVPHRSGRYGLSGLPFFKAPEGYGEMHGLSLRLVFRSQQ